MKNILLAITLALFLLPSAPGIASAATKHSPAPHSGKFSQERLHRIDEVLDRYVQEQRIAGAVLLVLRDGTPVYQRAAGWSDREAQRPMQMNTIFRIASQTKALTSVVALSLAEEGKLSFGNKASEYIPTFANTTVAVGEGDKASIVAAKRPITLHDLLTHTAGISYGTQPSVAKLYAEKQLGPAAGPGWYLADKDEPVCDSMTRLGTLPFVSQPGETFVYGYNIDIVGCVAERASGMPLDELIRKRITEPLHLNDTQFFLPPGQRERLATVYASTGGKAERSEEGAKGQGHYVDGPRRDFAGGAGLLSTAHDYARFLEMIRNDGTLDGVRILSPRSVALMHANLIGSRYAQDGLGFGYGFETVEKYGAKGMESAGSYGWGGAYGSTYFVDPQERLVAVFMIQLMPNDTDIREKITTLIYQALE